jgi:ABC-type phosphate/phosphonate transport system substrate-binding protein
MIGRRGLLVPSAALLSMLLLMAGRSGAENETRAVPIRIGLVNSLFRDTPEPLVNTMMQPFGAIMESQTGLAGKMVPAGDARHLGQLLAEDKVHLGVFHGFEFGWARLKHPEIRPLVIAVNQQRHLQALVVVRADAPPEGFASLKGKKLALPSHSREHCHLYLDRCCKTCGQEPKGFFGQVTTPDNVEDALDDLVDGLVNVVVVDSVSLECYRRRKPARCARLKVFQHSETFPAAVVAYHPGALDDDTLNKFRDGMINANKNALGRQFMTLWKLTAFEPVPADFDQTVTAIVKAYPPPAPAGK